MENTSDPSSEDPFLTYFDKQKGDLRTEFQAEISRMNEVKKRHRLELQPYSARLTEIKSHLALLDRMICDRKRSQESEGDVSLPNLGRFHQLAPQQAVTTLFESEPSARLSVRQILERLTADGFENRPNSAAVIHITCKRLMEKGILREYIHGTRREFFLAK